MLGICQSQASISEHFGKTFDLLKVNEPANVHLTAQSMEKDYADIQHRGLICV